MDLIEILLVELAKLASAQAQIFLKYSPVSNQILTLFRLLKGLNTKQTWVLKVSEI